MGSTVGFGDMPHGYNPASMRLAGIDERRLAAIGGLFLASAAFGAVMVRPFVTGSIGPDAAAPVIHFERILAGQHLEGYLGQTPKPVLTAIYGSLHAATHDWRSVAWAAIGAYALAVVLAAALAWRVAGPVAGAFTAVAFLGSPTLLVELVYAYAVPWALVAWLVAGLAVTAERPRYLVAGVALMLGSLARIETPLVVGVAVLGLLFAEIRARRGIGPTPPRGAYLVLVGLLAIPVLFVHDWLLTGDPLFWAKIAQANSEGVANIRGPIQVANWLALHLLTMAPLLLLAVLGVIELVRRRQWEVGLGLLALGPGVAAFLVFLAARGTFVSARYAAPIDLSLLFTAGLGLGLVDVPFIRRRLKVYLRRGPGRQTLPLAVGAVAAVAFAPFGPLDRDIRAALADQVRLHENARLAMAAIRTALGPVPSWRETSVAAAGQTRTLVIVPSQMRAQAVVDLDVPLTAVEKAKPNQIDPAKGRPEVGQIVYRDRVDAGDSEAYAVFEIDQPVTIGTFAVVPILVDSARGMWVVQIAEAPR